MYRIREETTDQVVAEVEFSTGIIEALPVSWVAGKEALMKAFYAGRIEQWAFYDGAPNKLRIRGYVVEQV